MKTLRQNKEFRVFCWQLLDVLIAFWITYLSWVQGERQIVALGIWIPVLTLISKKVNKALWDLGVDKDLESKE